MILRNELVFRYNKFNAAPFRYNLTLSLFRVLFLVKKFTKAQDEYNKLLIEQVNRNRKSIKLQVFINEIKATDTLNLEFNDLNLYINDICTTTAIFIAEMLYKSLLFAVFMPIKEKIANTFVSAILNSNGGAYEI